MHRLAISTALLFFSVQCAALQPSPSIEPREVVLFQLESLRLNNADGHGIASTFEFASPANKRVTGPLQRFSRLFENHRYTAMLNHQQATIVESKNTGSLATFRVELIDGDGSIHHYKFELSKQTGGSCTGCWMTDAVMWQPRPGRSA